MSVVVFERLPAGAYEEGCVFLPADYGTAAWERRPEVAAIRRAVFAALDRLDAETGAGERLRDRPVVVKPNLVLVYRDIGTERSAYPETTDPRVLDAAVLWLRERASSVAILEGAGRGAPTRTAFRLSGVDRLARRRGCELVAVEESPMARYFLPGARVQREILVPESLVPAIEGRGAYVSVPKLKTNLYTGVTLGFKNAMGLLPYNLRQRDHDASIEDKLVDILRLIKPSITLIDGVVGGEGECPAPVFPVDSRAIIVGDHAVETDRAATAFMGFDPNEIGLMRKADEAGFGDPDGARIVGDAAPVRFRPADRSLLSPRVRSLFPELTALYGLSPTEALGATTGTRPGDRPIAEPAAAAGARSATPELPRRSESACRGGCVASTRFGLAMMEAEGARFKRPALLAIGPGLPPGAPGNEAGAEPVWLDAEGRPWTARDVAGFKGLKAAVGSCSRPLAEYVDYFAAGCMPLANAPHAILHRLSGTRCAVLGARNRRLAGLLVDTLRCRAARRRLLLSGRRIDVAYPWEKKLEAERGPVGSDGASVAAGLSYLSWPLEPIVDPDERRGLLAAEDDLALASMNGVYRRGEARRLVRAAAGALTGLATWLPLAASAAAAAGGRYTASARFLTIWLSLMALHLAELPLALNAARRVGAGRPWRRVALTLAAGFPAWVGLRAEDAEGPEAAGRRIRPGR
mgnify:CR=1 FL=1